jgi:hypothetical protein
VKNSKQTLWLWMAVALLAGWVLLFERRFEQPVRMGLQAVLLTDFQPGAVTAIEWTAGTNRLRALRGEGSWRLVAPVGYPAQAALLDALLEQCARIESGRFIPAAEVEDQLAAFGLQPPRAVLRLEQGGRPLELRLGAPAPGGNHLYIQVSGQAGLHVVGDRLLDLLPRNPEDWRDTRLIAFDAAVANRIALRSGPRLFEAVRDPTNRLWRITSPPPVKRADSDRINLLLQQLQQWPVAGFITDDPKADLEPFGLVAPEAELLLANGTNAVLAIEFGKSPTNTAAAQVFARRLAHTNIVVVPRQWLEILRQPVWDFCDRRLVDTGMTQRVDRVEFRGPENFTLQRQANAPWTITEPVRAAADPELVAELLGGLSRLEAVELAKEVVTDFAAYGLAPPLARYSLLQSVTNGAGTTNSLLAQVDFGTGPVDRIFARRHDEGAVYVAPRGPLNRLPQAAWQLRDRRLWEFEATNVVSVLVSQNGRTNKLVRNAAQKWAGPGGPLNEVGAAGLEEALHRLGTARAVDWTARGAAALAQHGVTASSLSLVLEVAHGNQARTLTLRFGRRALAGHVYATTADPAGLEPVLFEFPKGLFDPFITPFLTITP